MPSSNSGTARHHQGPTSTQAWQRLTQDRTTIADVTLRDLFAEDAQRGTRFTVDACGIYADLSKNLITDDIVANLVELAHECGLTERIELMFRGDKINVSEHRSVLHTALQSAGFDAGCRRRRRGRTGARGVRPYGPLR